MRKGPEAAEWVYAVAYGLGLIGTFAAAALFARLLAPLWPQYGPIVAFVAASLVGLGIVQTLVAMASGLFSGWRYWVGAIPLVWGLAGAMLGIGWMLDLNTLLVMLAYPLVLGLLGLRRLRRELRRMPEQPA